MLTTKVFKLADQSYKTAVKVTSILGMIGFVLVIVAYSFGGIDLFILIVQWAFISTLLALWLIKSFYQLNWGRAFHVWQAWFVLYITLFFIIIFVLGSVIYG